MKKVFGTCILLLIFMGNLVCARTSEKNVSIVNAIIVSNDILIALLNSIDPGDSVETITNKDEIIFYDARVDVINPDKKHYTFKVICEDTKGDVIIQSVFKQSPYIVEDYINGDRIAHLRVHMGLDPKPLAMVTGQLLPLRDKNVYYIKLYCEGKLVGMTNFNYIFMK